MNIYLGVTVQNNDVHIYKNGQQIFTCSLDDIPENSTEPFTFFPEGGFNGFLGPFYYYDRPLNSETMQSEYENIVLEDMPDKIINIS